MTVLWVEPHRCRWCGEWTLRISFCSSLCERLHAQKRWVEMPHLMQQKEKNRG